MGWCSTPTDIFDNMAEDILGSTGISDEEKYRILYNLAESLEKEDWDCQSDSNYYDHPTVQRIFKELHPDWDEWEDDPKVEIITFANLAKAYKKEGKLDTLIEEMVQLFDKAWNDATSPLKLDQLYNTTIVAEGVTGWDWFVICDDDELAEKVAGVVKSVAGK